MRGRSRCNGRAQSGQAATSGHSSSNSPSAGSGATRHMTCHRPEQTPQKEQHRLLSSVSIWPPRDLYQSAELALSTRDRNCKGQLPRTRSGNNAAAAAPDRLMPIRVRQRRRSHFLGRTSRNSNLTSRPDTAPAKNTLQASAIAKECSGGNAAAEQTYRIAAASAMPATASLWGAAITEDGRPRGDASLVMGLMASLPGRDLRGQPYDGLAAASATVDQPPVPPWKFTMPGVVVIVAAPPEAVIAALLIHTPAVANKPHNTRPAMPRPI
jgi:hypothetical protein